MERMSLRWRLLAVFVLLPTIAFAQGSLDVPVRVTLDIPYAETGNPRQRLDLYLPQDRKREKLPVIVFLHGGGWSEGDRKDGAERLTGLVRAGEYAGVSAGYRLSGEAKWPAQIHDVKAAIRWLRANADTYGLDADRVGVWGISAGAHLALMLGVTGDVPSLEGDVGPHHGVSSQIAAVANFIGVSELLALIGPPSDLDHKQADSPGSELIGGPLLDNPAKARAASPITYVSSNDAPVLTLHGTGDRSVPYDQAVRLDRALRRAGVPSFLVPVKGADHEDFGKSGEERLLAFFDKYLRAIAIGVSTAPIEWPRR